MRLISTMTVSLIALAGLTACGPSEEGLRTAFRTQGTANCKAGADAATRAQLTQMGMSVDELCTCAIDRYLRTASFEQLKQDRDNPAPPALVRTTAQCVTDHAARAGATPGVPANAAAPGAETPPAAPAESGGEEENAAAEE